MTAMKSNSTIWLASRSWAVLFLVLALPLCEAESTSAKENDQVRSEEISPARQSPAWLREKPIVIVGNWDCAPIFRLRKGGNPLWAQQEYDRGHSEEAVIKLKELGVSLAILHFYKGFGLEAEKEQLEDAKKLAALCKKHSIRVGVYVGSTICYETFLAEVPEAEEWLVPSYRGKPATYPGTQVFRRRVYFNHPGFLKYMKRVCRIAIEELDADLIHFDNTSMRARRDVFFHPQGIEDFRTFLREKYTSKERTLRFGFAEMSHVQPPDYDKHLQTINSPMYQEWTDFRCQQLSDFYGEMTQFIHSLNPEVAVDNNPSTGLSGWNTMWDQSVDYPRILKHTDMVWSEEASGIGVTGNGILLSRIRSYKQATGHGNIVITSTADGLLEMAESLAFNRGCLGMVGGMLSGYELSESDRRRGSHDNPYTWGGQQDGYELTPRKKSYIHFFRKHFDYYRDVKSVANVAVLRAFSTMAFSNARPQQSTFLFEQALIQAKMPFDIIFDQSLDDLSKYRVLVLADQEALSDGQLEKIRAFVRGGGSLVATEHTSLYNEHRRRREEFGLADLLGVQAPPWLNPSRDGELILEIEPVRRQLGSSRIVYLPEVIPSIKKRSDDPMASRYWKLPKNAEQMIDAVRWALGDQNLLKIEGPAEVAAELVSVPGADALALHLVNYSVQRYPELANVWSARFSKPTQQKQTVYNLSVKLKIPDGNKVRQVLLFSPDCGKEQQILPHEGTSGTIQFVVPRLDIYCLVMIQFEAR